MKWKKCSYWLRGGLIGGILGIILYILGWIAEYSFIQKIISINIRYLITSPFCFQYLPSDDAVVCFVIFGLLSNVIIFGLIGVVIGKVYDIFRKR